MSQVRPIGVVHDQRREIQAVGKVEAGLKAKNAAEDQDPDPINLEVITDTNLVGRSHV